MVRQPHTTAAVAITLALVASLAPSASADPAPLARAEAAIAAAHSPASTTTASTGSSTPAPCGDVCSGHGYGNLDVVPLSPADRPTSTAADTTATYLICTPRARSCQSASKPVASAANPQRGGFDWGDAGVGAGASLVLLAIGLAATRTATKARKLHPAEQRTIATG